MSNRPCESISSRKIGIYLTERIIRDVCREKKRKKGKIGTILNDRIGRNGTEAFFWMSEKQEFHLVNARGLLSRLLESRKRGKVMARSYLNLGTVPPRVRD